MYPEATPAPRSKACRAIPLAIPIFALSLLAANAPAQSETELRSALEDYFGDEAAKKEARARLEAWGNAAMPALRSLAKREATRELDWALLCALTNLRSKEAATLWVDILNGDCAIAPHSARAAIPTYVPHMRVRAHLKRDKRLRPLAIALASSASSLERMQYLDFVRWMQWDDEAPRVRQLTRDLSVQVRKRAAQTLAHLTGENVKIREAPLRFLRTQLSPELFGKGQSLPTDSRWRQSAPSFTQWVDGTPCLLVGKGREFGANESGMARSIDFDLFGHRYLSLQGKSDRSFAVLVSDRSFGDAQYASGWAAGKGTTWTYKPPRLGIRDAAVLGDAGGTYGCLMAVGGKTGLVALDLEGKPLWQLQNHFVVYEASTHEDLPGQLLVVSGRTQYVQHDRSKRSPDLEQFPHTAAFAFASHGVLFPDEATRRAAILAGSGHQDQALVARFDAHGKPVWRAFVPGDIGGLAMLESKKAGRLFVIATSSGELIAFDEFGSLRARVELPRRSRDGDEPIYGVRSGRLANGEWAVAVGLLGGWQLYRLR